MFSEWLSARSISPDFENLNHTELNTALSQFYVEARREDGGIYSKSSLNAIRAGLQRYLQSAPWNWKTAIINNAVFATSSEVLVGVFKKMTSEGSVI